MKKLLATVALIAAIAAGTTACASSQPIEMSESTVVIDVRTPAEYSAGHLDGAVNIDVQSPNFDDEISTLPADGDYIIYCKSGNRAGQAISRMESLGFSSLVNAGGLGDAATATGLQIVSGG